MLLEFQAASFWHLRDLIISLTSIDERSTKAYRVNLQRAQMLGSASQLIRFASHTHPSYLSRQIFHSDIFSALGVETSARALIFHLGMITLSLCAAFLPVRLSGPAYSSDVAGDGPEETVCTFIRIYLLSHEKEKNMFRF